MMLYEALTGARPFQGEDTHALLYAVVHSEPPAIRTIKPDVPADLQRIVVGIVA